MSKKMWVFGVLFVLLLILSNILIAIPDPPPKPGEENTSNNSYEDADLINFTDPGIGNYPDPNNTLNTTLLDTNGKNNFDVLFFAGITFVVILLIILILIISKRLKIKKSVAERNNVTALRNYVASCRFKGYRDEAIRTQLIKSGYDSKTIEKVFR